jgi:hypothetical protein
MSVTVTKPCRMASGDVAISLDAQTAFPLGELLSTAFAHPTIQQILGPDRDLKAVLRPPSSARVKPLPDDLVFVEAAFRTEAWRTFFALRQWEVAHHIHDGRVQLDQQGGLFDSAFFYLGETAADGLLGKLTRGGYHPGDPDGYSESILGEHDLLRYRRLFRDKHGSDWQVFSSDHQMLDDGPSVELGHPDAQFRLHLGTVSESHLTETLRALAYLRARRQSASHALRLEEIMQQLHLTPREALVAAGESPFGVSACPLGGSFAWSTQAPVAAWVGTTWSQPSLFDEAAVPEDYRLPLLDQLRSADISVCLPLNEGEMDKIVTHIEMRFKKDEATRTRPPE